MTPIDTTALWLIFFVLALIPVALFSIGSELIKVRQSLDSIADSLENLITIKRSSRK